jgi:hypothetical protein
LLFSWFVAFNILFISEFYKELTSYELFRIITLSYLQGAMCYFIYQAVRYNMATNLFAYLFTCSVSCIYYFFRDLEHLIYPEDSLPSHKDISEAKYERKHMIINIISIVDVIISIICPLFCYSIYSTSYKSIFHKSLKKIPYSIALYSKLFFSFYLSV